MVYALENPSLVLWAQYIDDIFLLWNGSADSLQAFFDLLNENDIGISLTYTSSTEKITFLDLEILVVNERFQFKTFFKSTDRNSYIPADSCHHPSWIHSVPRSQFLRLRRNCSDINTFKVQAEALKMRLLDKGYSHSEIDSEISRTLEVDRASLLTTKPKPDTDNKFRWAMLTTFSTQYRQIKAIFTKHWDILKIDHILGPSLPEQAKMIFRGAPTLQSRIAPNIINPPTRTTFFQELTVSFPCRKCTVCQHNTGVGRKVVTFRSSVTNKQYSIKHFCTCETHYIVYLITCPCGKQYVGRTIRTFSIRVAEHISLIKSGDTKHPVPRHYRLHHNRNLKGTSFLIIDRYIALWRGGAKTRGSRNSRPSESTNYAPTRPMA